MKKIVILGTGGHAAVVADLLRAIGRTDFIKIGPEDEEKLLKTASPDDFDLALGMGMPSKDPVKGLTKRHEIGATLSRQGFHFPQLIHPSVVRAGNAIVGEGAQVMAGAVLQPRVVVGCFAIVNTRASIDHDCLLKMGCHVAPGATLGGDVEVGYESLVGIGATVLQGIRIGDRSLVAGGAMVVRTVRNGEVVMGVPATPTMLLPTPLRPWTGRTPFSDPMPEHGLT